MCLKSWEPQNAFVMRGLPRLQQCLGWGGVGGEHHIYTRTQGLEHCTEAMTGVITSSVSGFNVGPGGSLAAK